MIDFVNFCRKVHDEVGRKKKDCEVAFFVESVSSF